MQCALLVDTARTLIDDLFTQSYAEKDENFKIKIDSFVKHSDDTITMLKQKYEEFMTNDLAGDEHRDMTSTATVKHLDTVKDDGKYVCNWLLVHVDYMKDLFI